MAFPCLYLLVLFHTISSTSSTMQTTLHIHPDQHERILPDKVSSTIITRMTPGQTLQFPVIFEGNVMESSSSSLLSSSSSSPSSSLSLSSSSSSSSPSSSSSSLSSSLFYVSEDPSGEVARGSSSSTSSKLSLVSISVVLVDVARKEQQKRNKNTNGDDKGILFCLVVNANYPGEAFIFYNVSASAFSASSKSLTVISNHPTSSTSHLASSSPHTSSTTAHDVKHPSNASTLHQSPTRTTTTWSTTTSSDMHPQLLLTVQVVHSFTLDGLATFIGWVYFLAWVVTFYPQIWLLWRTNRADGFSYDLVLLQATGR